MLDKGYLKNMTKIKSKLNLDNSRPSFLEDDDSQFSSKFIKSANPIERPKIQTKSPKIFDLDQIKKQLGLIELRNSKSQNTVGLNKNVEQPEFFPQSSSFKKYKNEPKLKIEPSSTANGVSRFMVKKKETEPVNIKHQQKPQQQPVQEDKTGFTQRITELVKMRQQHEKIINSLVSKKTSNVSTDEETFNGFRRRNPDIETKYIRVLESYEVSKKQRQSEPQIAPERLSFKKEPFRSRQEQEPDQQVPKKRTAQQIYNEMQSKLSTPKKKQSKQKVYKTYSSSGNDESNQNISESVIQESVFETEIVAAKAQEMSNEGFQVPQSIQESQQYIVDESQLNESTFEMQEHVNLIASLSQFDFKNSGEQILKEVLLEDQLHFSVESQVKDNLRRSQKYGQKIQLKLKYTCMETGYQNSSAILKAVKKIKDLNGDFAQIVEFLCNNEAWEGLLVCESIQYQKSMKESSRSEISTLMEYRGLNFDNGSYSEVTLSNRPLEESEKKMLIFSMSNTNKTLICDITLILLSRLIDLRLNRQFPQMLNRLFGYQFKTFKIDKLNDFMECLDYIDRLREIHNKELKNQGGLIVEDKLNQSLKQKYSMKYIEYPEESQNEQMNEESKFLQDSEKHCDFFIFGHNKTTKCYELIRPCFFSEKNKTQAPIKLYEFRELMRHQKYMKKLSDTYDLLSITNNKQLPVKSIKLKHFDNHFVVVSVNVVEEGLYFMSVGSEAQNFDQSSELKYRICLISSSTKTILECLILSRNESYPVYLPKQEFEVFISAYQPNVFVKESYNQNAAQVVNFTFYIQSQHISAKNDLLHVEMMESKELEFELRLKEEYKNYTSMVLEQFIEFSFLDKEITKFFIQIDPELSNSQINQQINQSHTITLNESQTVQEQIKKPQIPQRSKLDEQFHSTVKSFKFPDTENRSQAEKSQKPVSDYEINHKKSISILQAEKQTKNSKLGQEEETFTFEQMQFQPKPHQLTILRVHLKALDLFIDCINTTSLKDLSKENQNDFEFKIKYCQQRVLCDLNHHKNAVLLRSNTINLIYLSKDSDIEQISKQNEFCSKTYANHHPIAHKIFRKQW